MVVTTTSKQVAIQLFNEEMMDTHSGNGEVEYWVQRQVNDIDMNTVFIDDDIQPRSEARMIMRRAYPVKYQFIQSEDKYWNNTGECVVDQIDKIYGLLIKQLARDNVIKQCSEIENGLDNN